MSGKALADGSHVITIRRKKGSGNIYANSTLSYFSLENPIPAAGNAVTWNAPITASERKR